MTATVSPRVEVPLTVSVDNSDGLRRIRPAAIGRARTINLLFEEAGYGGGYDVRAWGSAFPEDGAGAYRGMLDATRHDIDAYITEIRTTWNERLLGHQGSADFGQRRFPFADHLDLGDPARRPELDAVMRRLATSGQRLYRILFGSGDRGLKEIGELLTAALRDGTQVITVHSDELLAPWWMLYVPPDPTAIVDVDEGEWTFDGFLGYRHLIEHNFKRTPGWSPRLTVAGRVKAGLNVDSRLDAQFATTPPVGPVVELFRQHAAVTVRESRSHLAWDISSARFTDQVMYFGCHGAVSGIDSHEAQLRLTDGEPIFASDFRGWLASTPLTTNPVVIVNACQGGQMSSMFCASFGRILLQNGANCLLGPQIDIPPVFASAYAHELVPRLLCRGARLGDAVHEIARSFADRYRNPLGLAMSLYRGIDTHFLVEEHEG